MKERIRQVVKQENILRENGAKIQKMAQEIAKLFLNRKWKAIKKDHTISVKFANMLPKVDVPSNVRFWYRVDYRSIGLHIQTWEKSLIGESVTYWEKNIPICYCEDYATVSSIYDPIDSTPLSADKVIKDYEQIQLLRSRLYACENSLPVSFEKIRGF